MGVKSCTECGAELKLRSERCPLCGAATSPIAVRRPVVSDVEAYQDDVRRLRAQLKRLREDAEAV